MPTRSRSRTSKRDLIAPKDSKRYVRRNPQGEFKKEVSNGRSLAADRRQHAKTKVSKGQGDHGDTIELCEINRVFLSATPRHFQGTGDVRSRQSNSSSAAKL
jgi:hypothetical protein